jgi:hypothetical protein
LVLGILILFFSATSLLAQVGSDLSDENSDPFADPFFVDGFMLPFNPEKRDSRHDGPGNSVAKELPNVKINEVSRTEVSPNCELLKSKTTIYYPSGFGDKALDSLIANRAHKELEETKGMFDDVFKPKIRQKVYT